MLETIYEDEILIPKDENLKIQKTKKPNKKVKICWFYVISGTCSHKRKHPENKSIFIHNILHPDEVISRKLRKSLYHKNIKI